MGELDQRPQQGKGLAPLALQRRRGEGVLDAGGRPGSGVVGAGREPVRDIGHAVLGGQEDDRHALGLVVFFQQRASVVAAQDRQHDVEEDQVGRFVAGVLDADDGGFRADDFEFLAQHRFQEAAGVGVIFDDQDAVSLHKSVKKV